MFEKLEGLKKSSDQQGFTLLEILIAITITGIILGAVFSFLFRGLAIWEQSETDNEYAQYLRILDKYLREDLQQTFYSDLYSDNYFRGDYQGLEWLVLKEGALKRVSYNVDYYYNRLTRKESIIEGGYQTADNTSSVTDECKASELYFVCGEDLQSVGFYFYDPLEKYWENYWLEEDKGYLPSLVRVNILTGEREREFLFEIFVGREI